ncbi:hypothetical protein [Tropicibacter oceani]|uniref:Uncharacterized protein n=1 Tax=Tropicibacter oceani TaxID=3058420 RepID=A0ABY8QL45_9RHOB|nr:hypothetical protein [Tropicibacter oceani]WGW05245.1 hypothetical protein QF118_06785 [Tropicibacter oceani]
MIRIPLMALFLLPGAALAQTPYSFVTDPAMCAMDDMARNEAGMSFDGTGFWAIEYHCEIADPLPLPDWTSFQEHISAGYCEEPGALFPDVFVIRWSEFETGQISVYHGSGGEPETYHLCEG